MKPAIIFLHYQLAFAKSLIIVIGWNCFQPNRVWFDKFSHAQKKHEALSIK